MIVRPRPNLIDILFHMRGSILPRIAPRLLLMLLVSVAAVLLIGRRSESFEVFSGVPFTLIGLALSIFMSFRNNACYDRWWEGRRLWGQLIIATRGFARQIAHLDETIRSPLLFGLIGFAHGLAARLRDQDEAAAIAPWSLGDSQPTSPNATDAALAAVSRRCAGLAREGHLSDIWFSVLDTQLSILNQVQGGCERIKNTPLPYAFTLLLHRTAYIFCFLLPFALAHSLGWWTLLIVLVICYTFFGLDALGDEMEEPFGTDTNDLPLDAMVRLIEREMLAAAGRADLPPPLLPEHDLLI
jgi:putative membrane protein